MPTISIIVPVYNIEQYLSKCIGSILNQTFDDFELILVNDGSKDNSREICNNYAKVDKRIKVFHKENGGVSSARNLGLDMATGKYVGFVDGDDIIHKEMYFILYSNIIRHNSEIAVCEEKEIEDVTEKYDVSYVENFEIEVLDNRSALENLYKIKNIFAHPVNKIYDGKIFNDIRYPEGKIYEDQFVAPQILHKASRIVYVKSKLYFYIQREGSIVNSKFSPEKFDKVYALECNHKFFAQINECKLMNIAQKKYVDTLIWSDYIARKELVGIEKELDKLKKSLSENMKSIFKNPLISKKQKIMLMLYCFNPSLHYKIINSIRK